MCGIAGFYNFTSRNLQEDSIKKMLASIQHRGPDETGIYLSTGIALGSVRLSIIDLSSGKQPMSDESNNYWIVYNGEIFNYKELRSNLIKKGIHFNTNSDTEVVLQMFIVYGKKCVDYFNGQFAFCIFNKEKNELFLARDRVGIRPLFYSYCNNVFSFCSEIKGLFTLDHIPRKISLESLSQVFSFWTTISPFTSFESIFELPPGNYMVVNQQGLYSNKYWGLEKDYANHGNNHSTSFIDAADELDELLTNAVEIQLRADVQVGAYLSGGLDSSVTTSMINKIQPDVLNTFSISFKDKNFDESIYQKEAAAYFNTNHISIECTPQDIAEYFPKTIWHAEFPLLRTSPTPMYLLSKKVREQNLKVVITGEGADEMLAGYNIFKEAKIRRFWAKYPDSTIRPKLLSKLYPYLPMMKESNNISLKMFFGYQLTDTNNPLYSHNLRWHNTSRIKTFFSDEVNSHISKLDLYQQLNATLPGSFNTFSDLQQSQFLEASIFMSGYLLSSQGDRMAMGNSVEGRYPFLDHRVIEFCNKLPDNFKLNGLNEKYILKKISENKIPASITKRPKHPYRAPIVSSFLLKKSPEYIQELLSENVLHKYGLFNPQKVTNFVDKIKKQDVISEVDQMAFAGILSTQLLHKMFIEDKIYTDINSLKNITSILDY
jgi:asparagine synthase (glutamine-hydrolysing)